MLRHLLIALVLVLFTLTSALAEIVEGPLTDMVREAELIVIGTVVANERTGEKYISRLNGSKQEYTFYKATIEVESILKGDPNMREITIYQFNTSVDPTIHVGERDIFFIAKDPREFFKGRYSVVRGYAGMVRIVQDWVETHYIRGESKEQKLEDFIHKIRDLVGKKAN